MRHFLIWMMLAAAAGPAAGAPPQELELARQSCEQGKFLEAIRMFDRILNARAGTDAAAEADEALDRCVREVARSSEADDLLREISREYAGRAAGRKALSALALHALRLLEKCSPPPPLYEELLAHYGRTREAARVVIARANSCLGARKHEGEALRDLEKVGDAQAGKPEGAFALWLIGNYYREREDRDRAAIYYRRVIDSYPETLEYPYHPGLKLTKSARVDLEMLRTYRFSPLLDRLSGRIKHDFLQRVLGVDALDAGWLSTSFVMYIVPMGALGLVLLMVPFLRRGSGIPETTPNALFVRPWSLRSAAALLVGLWTVMLLLGVLTSLCFSKGYFSFWSLLNLHEGSTLVPYAFALVLVLRKEPLARVFGIDRKRLVRLAVAILGGIIGMVVLALILIIPFWWLGLVKLGPDVNRYLSNETSLSFEPWGWRVPIVTLAATAEEVLFRGVLHDALRRTVPTFAAAILGSFVFAMAHVRPLNTTIGTFAVGLVFVVLRERFRSLTPSTVCHCLWNFLLLAPR